MKSESIWKYQVKMAEREVLTSDQETDAVVIGGGMAGILTAYMLKEQGLNVIVLEADRIGSGQTGNTTAKITMQHNLFLGRMAKQTSEREALLYAEANLKAIEDYRSLIQKENISCQFRQCASYLYTQMEDKKEELEEEKRLVEKIGVKAELTTDTELPFPVAYALKFEGQAAFHPLMFLEAISKQLTVYEKTRVIKVEEQRVITDRAVVEAKHIIFATHFPFPLKPGYYFARMHQERSCLVAVKADAKLEHLYFGIDQEGYSLRREGDYVLIGGERYRTGENQTGGQYERLIRAAGRFYPDCPVFTKWSAQDCMPLDDVPYIGRFSSKTPNWYVATGFKKWGMTTSMVAAALIRDLIVSGNSPYEEVFTPERFHFEASAKQLMEDGMTSLKGLSKSFLTGAKTGIDELTPGHGGVVEYDGEKAGVYKEENGTCHIVDIKCPHLGCQLSWNPEELSWDCPCHGSRFDYEGRLIDGPAQEGLEHE